MKRFETTIAWGILLIACGVLFLLQNLGLLGNVTALVWALLFAAAGAVFLFVFLSDHANWWALIPGCTLLGIGALIGLDELAPAVANLIGGALVLGAIGLSFWIIYFIKREYWWAVIPGGTMLTLAVIATIDSAAVGGLGTGGILFLGLGLTFVLVSLLPRPEGQMKWALIPAAVLLVMGVALTAASASVLNYVWPAALVLVGLYLVFRNLTSRRTI